MSASGQPRLHPATYTLWLLLAAYGLALCGLGPALVAVADDYGVPLSQAGVLFTSFFLGFTSSVLLAGYLAERLGSKPVVLFGLGVLSASLLLFASAPAFRLFPLAIVTAGFIGSGGAIVESVSSALLADLNPKRAAFVLNISQGFFGIGAVGGPYLVGYLLGHGQSWRLHFYLSGGVTAVLLVGLALQAIRREPTPPVTWAGLRNMLQGAPLQLGALAMVLYIGAEIGFSGWVSAFAQKELAAAPALAAQAVGLYWLGMTVGRFGSGWAAERLGPELLVAGLALASAVTVLATALATSPALALAFAFAVGLSMSGIFASILTSGGDHHPGHRGTALSLIMASIGLGGMSFPAGMGLLADALGLRWAMLVPAGLSVALAAAMLRLRSLRPQLAGNQADGGEET